MSLLGGIADYYTTASTTPIESLRAIVGTEFYADIMTEEPSMPYIVLKENGRDVTDLVKGLETWIEKVSVGFNVVGTGREQVEGVLLLLEDGFIPGEQITMTTGNRTHMATYPGDRSQEIAEGTNGDLWYGMVELIFQLQRGT
jgi:hypothetical protein